jgi:hypothetical protein
MAFDFFNVSVQLQLYTLLYIQVDVIICEWMGYALLYESMLGANVFPYLFADVLLMRVDGLCAAVRVDARQKLRHFSFFIFSFKCQCFSTFLLRLTIY